VTRDIIHSIRISLLTEALEASKTEYSNLLKDFTDLDTKAQNTTAVAGIFLAGSLAFYNGDPLSKLSGFGVVAVALLGAAVMFLVVSVVFSIGTMKLRDITQVNSAIDKEDVNNLLRAGLADQEWSEAYERYINLRINAWQVASDDLALRNYEKARTLSRAQLFLNFAVLVVGLVLLTALFGNLILRFRK
jgi:hypothetical protein